MSMNDASGADERALSKAVLTGKKQTAMELIVGGKSVAEAARTCGIDRNTIFRWLRKDTVFQAAYNQWKEELKETCQGRLLALTEKATGALEVALDKGDAKTAMQLLTRLGMIEKQKPECLDEEEIAERAEIAEKKRKIDLEAAKRRVEIDDQVDRMMDRDLEKMAGEWDKPGGGNKSVTWGKG